MGRGHAPACTKVVGMGGDGSHTHGTVQRGRGGRQSCSCRHLGMLGHPPQLISVLTQKQQRHPPAASTPQGGAAQTTPCFPKPLRKRFSLDLTQNPFSSGFSICHGLPRSLGSCPWGWLGEIRAGGHVVHADGCFSCQHHGCTMPLGLPGPPHPNQASSPIAFLTTAWSGPELGHVGLVPGVPCAIWDPLVDQEGPGLATG